MAIKFSEIHVNLARERYYGKIYFNHNLNLFKAIINKILIYNFKIKILITNFKKSIFSFFIKIIKKRNEKFNQIDFKLNLNNLNLEHLSSKLKENNYIFIENFFNDDSNKHILKYWLNINFFSQSSNILKSYSTGFGDLSNKNFNYYVGIKKLFTFIKSSEFAKSINELFKFEKPIFVPSTLKNSLLIYNSTPEFYHRFNFTSLEKKIFRKTINFQFFPKDL